MIIYVKMNIFESPAQVIVNTVNTVGVMGKGLAKQYKDIYPDMFEKYQRFCEDNKLEIGKLWIYKTNNKWILNFPTKKHWRQPSKLEYIEEGLKKFVETYEEKGIRSISFPPLGCGNGGLEWESEVKPLMERYLKNLEIDIFIHLPIEENDTIKPEHLNKTKVKNWLMSEPKSLSFIQVWEDIKNIINKDSLTELSGIKCKILIDFSDDYEDDLITIYSITNENHFQHITKEELSEAWDILKQNGMLTAKMLPSNLLELSTSIFGILLKLPYIDSILTVAKQNENEINQTSIRLKPLEKYDSYQGEYLE